MYYYITVASREKVSEVLKHTGHVIETDSEEHASKLFRKDMKKFIGDRKFLHFKIKPVDMETNHGKALIERRKKGLGGSIWYEEKGWLFNKLKHYGKEKDS